MKITVIEQTLTDGSKVYDVHIGNFMSLPACSQSDAITLSEKIADAINAHSTEKAVASWAIPA